MIDSCKRYPLSHPWKKQEQFLPRNSTHSNRIVISQRIPAKREESSSHTSGASRRRVTQDGPHPLRTNQGLFHLCRFSEAGWPDSKAGHHGRPRLSTRPSKYVSASEAVANCKTAKPQRLGGSSLQGAYPWLAKRHRRAGNQVMDSIRISQHSESVSTQRIGWNHNCSKIIHPRFDINFKPTTAPLFRLAVDFNFLDATSFVVNTEDEFLTRRQTFDG